MKLYQYPHNAYVGTNIPKNRLYQQGKGGAAIEQLFIDEIERITWQFKLSAATLNLQVDEKLPEFQIFHIQARVPQISESILHYIDKQIPSPIIFEIEYRNKITVAAAYKRISQADGNKSVQDRYYFSDGLPADTSRQPLPFYLKLSDLYAHLIDRLLPLSANANIMPSENIQQRLIQAQERQQLQKQIDQLKSRIKKEKQFNRQAELNQQLAHLEQTLNQFK